MTNDLYFEVAHKRDALEEVMNQITTLKTQLNNLEVIKTTLEDSICVNCYNKGDSHKYPCNMCKNHKTDLNVLPYYKDVRGIVEDMWVCRENK